MGYNDEFSCCASPQQEFSIRNDGSEPLASGTTVTISLPAGVISNEGLCRIREYLQLMANRAPSAEMGRLYSLSWRLEELGAQVQGKTGNFTKRLSKLAYDEYQLKLSPVIMSQAGVITADHSKGASVAVEVTRELNHSAAYFANDGSCFWGSYEKSRCALKTNGGFALRSLSSYRNGVSGRAWVLPLRYSGGGRDAHGRFVKRTGLHPTFDTVTPDAFMVFNGYGDLDGYAAPRLLAHMAGWSYRKVAFESTYLYVNAGGYLVARQDTCERFKGGVSLDLSRHARLFQEEQARTAAKAAA